MTALTRFFTPHKIAVIGGGFWGKNTVAQLQSIGFSGQIGIIHPHADQINGIACVRDLNQLSFIPDAAFIAINREETPAVVAALSQMGAGGAVCFASGFDETASDDAQGAILQAELLDAAGDMPLLGPNCYGFINMLDRVCLWPDQHGCRPVERGVGIITQSSNISINISMQQRGLPIAYMVTVGNQAKIDMSDIGHALLADDRISALGLHIEGIKDLPKFTALAQHAASLGKPIVALKVGASKAAQAASITHTASLAGSHSGAQAVFDRLGIAYVDNLAQFINALNIANHLPDLKTPSVMSFSCSGGEASLMADAGQRAGIDFPALSAKQRTGLAQVLGSRVHLTNPLDYHTYIWGDLPAMQAMFAAGFEGAAALNIVVLDIPNAQHCDSSAWTAVLEPITAAAAQCKRPVGVLTSLPENLPDDWAQCLANRGLIPLHGLDDALGAITALAHRRKPHDGAILQSPAPENPKTLSEFEAKTLLATAGLIIGTHHLVDTAEQAVQAAERIGYPVVLKTQGIAHKSEQNGVYLNLQSADAVKDAAQTLPNGAMLVEPMIKDGLVELLLGVTRDPAHGYILTIGAGGILSELLQDTQQLSIPADRMTIANALADLRVYTLICGYRGKPAANIDAIIDTIENLQGFVINHDSPLAEVEINPLICTRDSAIVADALISMEIKNDR